MTVAATAGQFRLTYSGQILGGQAAAPPTSRSTPPRPKFRVRSNAHSKPGRILVMAVPVTE